MEKLVLANVLNEIDFDLLISEKVKSIRDYWGEMMEIIISDGAIVIFIDEKKNGFIKIYETIDRRMPETITVTEDNLQNVMKYAIDKLKGDV